MRHETGMSENFVSQPRTAHTRVALSREKTPKWVPRDVVPVPFAWLDLANIGTFQMTQACNRKYTEIVSRMAAKGGGYV
jgi:hypothetical protein